MFARPPARSAVTECPHLRETVPLHDAAQPLPELARERDQHRMVEPLVQIGPEIGAVLLAVEPDRRLHAKALKGGEGGCAEQIVDDDHRWRRRMVAPLDCAHVEARVERGRDGLLRRAINHPVVDGADELTLRRRERARRTRLALVAEAGKHLAEALAHFGKRRRDPALLQQVADLRQVEFELGSRCGAESLLLGGIEHS